MFVFILCILGAISLSVTSAFTFLPVDVWYDFWKPLLMFIAGYLGGVVIAWIFIDICGRIMSSYKKKYDRPSKFARFLLTQGMWFIDFHANVRLKKIGLDKLPNEPFLMVGNHKSKFDPMIAAAVFRKRDIAFVTKQDNMKIPLAARLMWRNCYLPVDRTDKLQSLEQFKRAAELISSGASSVGVYPEGSRQEEHVILADFHNGTFNVAIKTGCPIVILTMKGTSKIKKNFPFKRSKVSIKIVQVLYKEDYEGMNATQLSDYVHEIMYNDLKD